MFFKNNFLTILLFDVALAWQILKQECILMIEVCLQGLEYLNINVKKCSR